MATKKKAVSTQRKKTKISSKDIKSVSQKLESFVKDLPKQEQDILGWVLTRAQAAPPAEQTAAIAANRSAQSTVEIGGLQSPISVQLAKSVGLGAIKGADVTVVVGWAYRFQ